MAGKMSTFTKKRIFADVRELKEDASSEYVAEPLEDNIFEWHFTIKGPKGTDFEGGIYHGRILLPTDYPFKPPNIVFLTPNGRFEVGKKICLSISAHHPEEWQAAWGIRLILEALISFLPTEGGGAVGALDYSSNERKSLALKSQNYCCDRCGGNISDLFPSHNDQDDQDDDANDEEQGADENNKKLSKKELSKSKYADAIAQLHCHAPKSPSATPQKTQTEESLSPTLSNDGSGGGGGGGEDVLPPLSPLEPIKSMSSPITPEQEKNQNDIVVPSPAGCVADIIKSIGEESADGSSGGISTPLSTPDKRTEGIIDSSVHSTPTAVHSSSSSPTTATTTSPSSTDLLRQRRNHISTNPSQHVPMSQQIPQALTGATRRGGGGVTGDGGGGVEQRRRPATTQPQTGGGGGFDGLLLVSWILGILIVFLIIRKIARILGLEVMFGFSQDVP
mmetsp:Transcript_7450/g.8852  ORF Transcript_7450/g.8852 Transcript_7450/m.8852 type:complete len:449 (+) Transcript_7450:94-1440(+)